MKKQTKNILPIWIAVLVLGILFQIIGRVLHFPFWLVWLTNLLCWGGTGVWVGLHFILVNKGKLKGSQLFVQNRAVYERVSREINEAISRYLVSVNRTGFLKSSALYERPWFLVCGPKKSGKTQLLLGSGLDFPLKYPSEKDGMILEEGSGISWNFGNDAVWVDMPGIMMENSGKEEWKATVNALCQVRSKRAVDGVVMVVNANRVIESEPGKIKEIASSLRERLDELITTWGIEFPVYLVISRSDEIPGFNELFHEPAGKWNEQILGATLSETQRRTLPRFVFIEEFELLASSLKNMQFRILAREKDAAARRMICRFVIHFEGLQQKLGDFIAEIFKPSSYEGKPVFRGFYFTSCQAVPSDEIVELHTQIDMGNLLIKHPFNPHRSEVTEASASGKSHNIQIRSFFTNPLFNKVIPTGISLVKRTEKFSRKEMIKHYSFIAVIAILMLLLGWHFFLSAKHSIGLNNKIEKEIIQTKSQTYSRLEAYKMLGRMGDMISLLKKIDDKRMPFLIGVGLYRGECVFNALKKEYFTKLKKLIVGPSMRFMEYKIKGYTSSFGELSSEDYNELYKLLKAYLSISEAVSGKLEIVDTVLLHNVLLDAVKYSLLSLERKSRLSQNVETVLKNNINLYLLFLKKGEFPLVQENQHLVLKARKRLCRLPNAQVLYESVITRLSPDEQQISLDDILGRDGIGILKSADNISSLYTQEGWDKYVHGALKDMSKDPYKIDWVIGTAKEQMPKSDLNPEKLYHNMAEAYFQDVKDNWLLFISSVKIDPFGDIARSSRILQKLGRDQSELVRFLKKITEYTHIKERSGKKIEVPDIVSKAVSKKTKKLKKMKVEQVSLLKGKRVADDLDDSFEPLRSFVRSEEGSLSGMEGYRDKILTLSEKLSTVQSQEGDKIVTMFNGKEIDPLFSSWTFTKKELTGMPDELARCLEKILLSPIDYTGKAVSDVLKKQLNILWRNDVIPIFTNRFTGRYPFSRNGDEALFNDVMDFFRPSTGVLWGFYDRRLSQFVVKNNSQWEVRELGSLKVQFDPKLIETLKKAEEIRNIYFQPDGTLRTRKLTISSIKTNKNRAIFKIGESEFNFIPVKEPQKAKFLWPVETEEKGASLKIYANDNITNDFVCSGQWGLIRLFEKAKINIVNQNSFTAKWQVNVQNTYMIYFVCNIQVAGSDHPFRKKIFEGFDCPVKITVE